jgi:hypothetical protein
MLFGHLATRFSTSPENLATEALAFIVNRSPAMREALRRLVGRTGIELPRLETFRSQAGDEQSSSLRHVPANVSSRNPQRPLCLNGGNLS